MSDALQALRDAVDHLEALGALRHPSTSGRSGAAVARAIGEGVDPVTALAHAGASPDLLRFVRTAAPGDLPAALRTVTAAVGRSTVRRRAFASAAFYPFVLALAATALSVVVTGGMRPAMYAVSALSDATPPLWPAPIAFVASIALLLLLGASMRSGRPLFPFVAARRGHERAVVLSIALAATKAGSTLPVGLRAASSFSTDPLVKRAALALAADLERGNATAGSRDLFGPVGAALFAAAVSQGGGAAVLTALAELNESVAEADLPLQLMRAQMLSLVLGGLAIGLSAVSFARIYTLPFAQ